MKNTFLILATGLLLSFSAEAQKKKKTKIKAKLDVPELVSTSFKTQYSDVADNKWSKNYSGYYVANFTNATSQKQTIEYNLKGEPVKTRISYDVAALPEVITNALLTPFPNATVTEASRLEMAGMKPYYKVKLTTAENKNKELYITEEGVITQ
jgi:hypothetical protein